ncbi:MAG: tetratricopeptide repeat protein [Synechococcales cyanobacterium CRU_2_2]|nr:tetratricopeptide repeat protein [Synechococcales cyanobacterium CRU_2_2]
MILIDFKVAQYESFYNQAVDLAAAGQREAAIALYDQAIVHKPDYHEAWYNRGNALATLGRGEEAIASFEQAVAIKADKHEAWYNRGIELAALGRYAAAIESYDRAIAIKPDKHEAWYNRACAYGLLGQTEQATLNLAQAMGLSDRYGLLARTDSDFERIRQNQAFQTLVQGGLQHKPTDPAASDRA